ncbi:cytochrome P450 [Phytoactinopolyspora halotolerans]|uniref:Cytochrome P450 n=1 Tax=Phytoactinopolyspora halotolerans TaxID=1981512 RepID=A0A6L9S4V6_9ACTN|nr:cytochrome P450 [Phytoactinopolyspora halotolerans]NED99780.1 cytochrome P450 [Phytoactinopolyspora halotolerans]
MKVPGTTHLDEPRDRAPDSTLMLVNDGYRFFLNRLNHHHQDVFETRLFGERAICMHGPEAARVFYDPERFGRSHAVPSRVQKTLQGQGGVQGLDGDAHRHRKAAFMRLMTEDRVADLVDLFERGWRDVLPRWELSDRVVLFEEAQELLCRAACTWAGIPLHDDEVPHRAQDMAAMVDAFGAVGPRHWRGRLARLRSETWMKRIVAAARSGHVETFEPSALHTFAYHRDLDGELLDTRVAAVEVLNVLRPIVAISWYVAFIAVALRDHPEWRDRIRSDAGGHESELFVQEVRRVYPLTPFVGARVRRSFEWHGHRFDEGTLVLLDVYGAHRDGRVWERPGEFDPERFRGWSSDGFDLIPQGGGDHYRDHRCAGEWITIALMKSAARLLCTTIKYQVPKQDLHIDLRRMPTAPRSGVVIDRVERVA